MKTQALLVPSILLAAGLLAWGCERPEPGPVPVDTTPAVDTLPTEDSVKCPYDNPLTDLPWLKAFVDQYDQDTTTFLRICTCTLESGDTGFVVVVYTEEPFYYYESGDRSRFIESGVYACTGERLCDLDYWYFGFKDAHISDVWCIYQNYPHRSDSCFCSVANAVEDIGWLKYEIMMAENDPNATLQIQSCQYIKNNDGVLRDGIFYDPWYMATDGSSYLLDCLYNYLASYGGMGGNNGSGEYQLVPGSFVTLYEKRPTDNDD